MLSKNFVSDVLERGPACILNASSQILFSCLLHLKKNTKMGCFHVFRVLEGWEDRIKVQPTSQLYTALRTSINIINTELGMSCLAGERGEDALTQNEMGSPSWRGGHT